LATPEQQPLRIVSNTATEQSVVVVVCVAAAAVHVSAEMAQRALAQMDSLTEHSCRSGELGTFGQNIIGASLPHLMEHVAIDILVRELPGQAFAGNTKKIVMDTHVDTSIEGKASCANEYQYGVRIGIPGTNLTAHLAKQILTALISASTIVNELSCTHEQRRPDTV
jgi:hypothetical protein